MDKKTFEQLIKDGKVTVTGFLNAAGEFVGDEEKLDQYAAAYVAETGVIKIDNGEVVLTPEYKENHGGGESYQMTWDAPENLRVRGEGSAWIYFSVETESYDLIDDFEVSFSADFPTDSMNVFSVDGTPIESGVWYNSAIFDADGPKAIKLQSLVNENSSTPFTLYTRKDGQVMSKSCTVEVEEVPPYYLRGSFTELDSMVLNDSGSPGEWFRKSFYVEDGTTGEPVSNQYIEVMWEGPNDIIFYDYPGMNMSFEHDTWYNVRSWWEREDPITPFFLCCRELGDPGTFTLNARVKDSNDEVLYTLSKSVPFTTEHLPQKPSGSFVKNNPIIYLEHKYNLEGTIDSAGDYGSNQCKLYIKKEYPYASFKFYKDNVEIVPEGDYDYNRKYVIFEGTVSECVDLFNWESQSKPTISFELMSRLEDLEDVSEIYIFDVMLDIEASESLDAVSLAYGQIQYDASTVIDNPQSSEFIVSPSSINISQAENCEFTVRPVLTYEDYSNWHGRFTLSAPGAVLQKFEDWSMLWTDVDQESQLPTSIGETNLFRVTGARSEVMTAKVDVDFVMDNPPATTEIPLTITAAPSDQLKVYFKDSEYNNAYKELVKELVFDNGQASVNVSYWQARNTLYFELCLNDSEDLSFNLNYDSDQLNISTDMASPLTPHHNLAKCEVSVSCQEVQGGNTYSFTVCTKEYGDLIVNINVAQEEI